MDRPTESWDALIRLQARVFTVDQAAAHGVAYHRIRSRVRSGKWQKIHPRVYAAHNGPLDYEARVWAAVLSAGDGAVLCRETAAYAWGLVDRPSAVVHVLVTGSRHPRPVRGVAAHRTRDLPRSEVHRPSRAPDRTSVERTVLDLIDQSGAADDVCAIVSGAVQRGRTTADRLARALEHRPRLRNRRLAREVVALAAEGAHSLLEVRHAAIGRRHGLPAPTRQAPRVQGDRTWYLDVLYEQFGVVVELDGRLAHIDARGWWKDLDRDNRLQTAGLIVLRFPGFVVLTDPCRVAADIARALRSRGWNASHRSCTTCPANAPLSVAGNGASGLLPGPRIASRPGPAVVCGR